MNAVGRDVVALRKGTSAETPAIAYERGRNEILLAAKVDQVKSIRDQAEALRRYWLQRKDEAMHVAFSAIRTRADYEIGVRSRVLEKAPPLRGDLSSSPKANKIGVRSRALEKAQGIRHDLTSSPKATKIGVRSKALEKVTGPGVFLKKTSPGSNFFSYGK